MGIVRVGAVLSLLAVGCSSDPSNGTSQDESTTETTTETTDDGGDASTATGDPGCPPGQFECDGSCVDTQIDLDHCGACDSACTLPNAETECAAGECAFVACLSGFEDCNEQIEPDGCEADLSASKIDCGTCGTTCGHAATCVSGECIHSELNPEQWRVVELQTEGCVANSDAGEWLGGPRGGLAVGELGVYYNGEGAIGGFAYLDAATLTASELFWYDGIFSDLASGRMWELTSGNSPHRACPFNFGPVDGFEWVSEEDFDTGSPIDMGASVDLCGNLPVGSTSGIFQGMGMVVLFDGDGAHDVSIGDGTNSYGTSVTLETAAKNPIPTVWGWAERWDGETRVVYGRDESPEGGHAIVRQNLFDGGVQTLLDLDALAARTGGTSGDIANVAINPTRSVWIYYSDEIRGMLGAESDAAATLGICPMTFETR